MLRKKVIITPMGGHATTYIHRHIGICAKRPDVCWKEGLNIETFPDPKKSKLWANRTRGHILDPTKTIEQNLIDMIKWSENWVLLSGWCSMRKKFLTRNNIKAYCIVRHPLHAYISYFGHQHPNHCRTFGGFNTDAAVRKWAGQWNPIINDFLDSGNKIIRHEFFYRDAPYNSTLRKQLTHFDTTRRNHGELKRPLVRLLKDLVNDNFYKIYDDWDI